MVTRREVITLMSGTALAAGEACVFWPRAANAQQRATMPLIGFLNPGTKSSPTYVRRLDVFRQVLAQAGFVEGRSVVFEQYWVEGQFDRLPEIAADLARRNPVVIVTASPPATRAAMAATKIIPIVFSMGEDPVREGIIASLNRPGGNATGFSDFRNQLAGKRLQLLRQAIPKAAQIGMLVNPVNPNAQPDANDTKEAAAVLGQESHVFNASTDDELERAFAAMAQKRIDAVVVNVDLLFRGRTKEIASLAARFAIPAIYEWREFAVAGGLMSYGTDDNEGNRLLAGYVVRILKGEKPADLPVQQAIRFELVINLKTANALKLDIAPGILAIADEVIE